MARVRKRPPLPSPLLQRRRGGGFLRHALRLALRANKLMRRKQSEPDQQNRPDNLVLWQIAWDEEIHVQGDSQFHASDNEIENAWAEARGGARTALRYPLHEPATR